MGIAGLVSVRRGGVVYTIFSALVETT